MGLELLLNGGVIGIVAVIAGTTHGVFYPIVELPLHGILEMRAPAFSH